MIPAIGQTVEADALMPLKELRWSKRETILAGNIPKESSIASVFAAGDAVSGPATVVEAIGGGKRAAEAIDRCLRNIPQPEMPRVPVRRSRLECLEVPASTKMILKRPQMPLLNTDRRRITFQQVELGYPESAVREEARRCLRCDICRRCGRCVEICRDQMGVNALHLGYLNFDHPGASDLRLTSESCIACGACAANCPNEAMVMRDQEGERFLSLCGTTLNRLELECCEQCGAELGPTRYHDFISQRLIKADMPPQDRTLCATCARRLMAARCAENLPPG